MTSSSCCLLPFPSLETSVRPTKNRDETVQPLKVMRVEEEIWVRVYDAPLGLRLQSEKINGVSSHMRTIMIGCCFFPVVDWLNRTNQQAANPSPLRISGPRIIEIEGLSEAKKPLFSGKFILYTYWLDDYIVDEPLPKDDQLVV